MYRDLSQLLGCRPFLGLSRHPLLLSPFYARLFMSAFYTGSLHLFGRRNTLPPEAILATFVYRGGANYRLTLNIYRSPLERARCYSKRSLIFQRKPAVLLLAER